MMLFVYGTLRQGHSNAHLLDGLGSYVGTATMRGTLCRVAHYPGLVDRGETPVRGELFQFADEERSFPPLDAFEGPEYERVLREALHEDGSTALVWVYLYRGAIEGKPIIESGDWTEASGQA